MPINSSLLTITLHSLVRTTFVFNDIKYFYDVITEFDSVPVTLSSPTVPTDFKTGWVPEAICTNNRGEKSLAGARNRNTIPSSPQRSPLPSSVHLLRYSGTHSLLCNLREFIPCLGRASCAPVMIWQQLSREWGFRITYTMRLPLQYKVRLFISFAYFVEVFSSILKAHLS